MRVEKLHMVHKNAGRPTIGESVETAREKKKKTVDAAVRAFASRRGFKITQITKIKEWHQCETVEVKDDFLPPSDIHLVAAAAVDRVREERSHSLKNFVHPVLGMLAPD